jgi:mono/diheme cytochrome c family protein
MKRTILISVALGLALSASWSGARASAPADGRQLFAENCAQCHNATSADTKVGPGLKGLFKNKTLPASGRPATVANVTSQIKRGGNGMPGFAGQLDATQISALVAYLKTL